MIYINDIDDSVACKILKFADDTKIYSSVGSATDIEKLQSDLYKLISWSKDWQMLFNMDKCKVMHMGYNNLQAEYVTGGSILESVNEEKDLGVIITEIWPIFFVLPGTITLIYDMI